MNYINKLTGQYPVNESQIRDYYPNTSFPVPFVPIEPFELVQPQFQPEYNSMTHTVVERAPQNTAIGFIQTWEVIELSLEEKQQKQKEMTDALIKETIGHTQAVLDSFAQTRNYAGIMSACTYTNSIIPKFRVEAEYCCYIRDITWAKLYELFDQYSSGAKPMPASYLDVVAELPVRQWPE
jgi:hypothetical protein